MHIFKETTVLRKFVEKKRQEGARIGFVPTMGALHPGHISLISKAKEENDIVVCSIYVNPTQFNNPSDLTHYPRQVEQDISMLQSAGCNALFLPDTETMYPGGAEQAALTTLSFGILEHQMEGRFRPGHFNGVGIVVSKLLHMVAPHRAYFGQKDLQQLLIIRKLVRDLSFPVEVVACPTLREGSGLAMSSRNQRLTDTEKSIAPLLHKTLSGMLSRLLSGTDVSATVTWGREQISAEPAFTLEYLEVCELNTLSSIEDGKLGQEFAICIAAHLGTVRLIDNVLWEGQNRQV